MGICGSTNDSSSRHNKKTFDEVNVEYEQKTKANNVYSSISYQQQRFPPGANFIHNRQSK